MIDGDEQFRNALAANLRDDGHEVREYASPLELPALDNLDEFDVVISDCAMRGRHSLTFADELHAAYPAADIHLMTAFWSEDIDREVASRNFLHLHRKPLDYEDLRLSRQPASR